MFLFYTIYSIILSVHISYVDEDLLNQFVYPMLAIFTIISLTYNLIEIYIEITEYIQDLWNIVDTCANVLMIVYLFQYRLDMDHEDRKQVLAFANFFCWLRVIGYFRLWESTRYLIRMIL